MRKMFSNLLIVSGVAAVLVVSGSVLLSSNQAAAEENLKPVAKSFRDAQAQAPAPHVAGEYCADLRGATGVDYYCASSVLGSQSRNQYGVDNLFSNTSKEAWVEGVPGQGIGEWVTIDFKELRSVKAVILRNGYQKRPDLFAKNSRVRKFKIVTSTGETRDIDLKDTMDLQTIPIDPPVTTTWIKFVVDDVYPGASYTDTAVTKLFVTSEPVR
jgi:hypothetical protein